MEKREMRLELKSTPTEVKPIFADEVMLGTSVKVTKEGNGEVRKEGIVRFGFIDMVRGQMLVEVILTPMTARALYKILGDNLNKLEEELKSKKLPEKPVVTEERSTSYIG